VREGNLYGVKAECGGRYCEGGQCFAKGSMEGASVSKKEVSRKAVFSRKVV
jgi:hypothetical protein